MCLAIPGRIARLTDDPPLARSGVVDFGGVTKDVCLAFVPDAVVGDYVLVHAGFAISRVDEKEAGRVFQYLQQIDELRELGPA